MVSVDVDNLYKLSTLWLHDKLCGQKWWLQRTDFWVLAMQQVLAGSDNFNINPQ